MMDEFLSQVYGTGELVKQAQEQNQAVQELYGAFEATVEEMAKQGSLDPSQLTEQDMAEMWNGFVEKFAEYESAEDEAEQVVEKLAAQYGITKEAWNQADAMGRIMAHSYTDEMSKIAGLPKKPTAAPKPGHEWVLGTTTKGGQKWHEVPKTMGTKATETARGIGHNVMQVFKQGKGGKFLKGQLPRAGRIGAMLAAPAAAGAAAYGGYKGIQALRGGKEKASALGIPEEAVYEHAYELLKNANWVFPSGEVIPPEHGMQLMKQAQEEGGESEEEKKKKEEEGKKGEEEEKQAALTMAALEHLAEAGYPVNV